MYYTVDIKKVDSIHVKDNFFPEGGVLQAVYHSQLTLSKPLGTMVQTDQSIVGVQLGFGIRRGEGIWKNSCISKIYMFLHADFKGVEFYATRRYVNTYEKLWTIGILLCK